MRRRPEVLAPFALLRAGLACLTIAACAEPRVAGPAERGAALAGGAAFPAAIALPNGFGPDGIASGRGTMLYAGSISSGAVDQTDAHGRGRTARAGAAGSKK